MSYSDHILWWETRLLIYFKSSREVKKTHQVYNNDLYFYGEMKAWEFISVQFT